MCGHPFFKLQKQIPDLEFTYLNLSSTTLAYNDNPLSSSNHSLVGTREARAKCIPVKGVTTGDRSQRSRLEPAVTRRLKAYKRWKTVK